MKKFLVAVLAVICLTCIGVVAGCEEVQVVPEPNYYSLSWVTPEGISIKSDVPANNDVKEGVTVTFSVVYDNNASDYSYSTDSGLPRVVVNANDSSTTLIPDEEGSYSFAVSGDSVIRVDGVFLIDDYRLTFGSTDTYRISYDLVTTGLEGDVDGGVTVRGGTQVSFSLNVSAYYKRDAGDYDVLSNTQIISPNEDGVYTVNVVENTNITVQGLTLDDNFSTRQDGNGSSTNPFRLRRPIDLYTMASIINDSFFSQYYNSYYSLENDIDLDGEQLFIIGDQISSSTAFFGGDFNGNGHKISNFYISDTIIDQETYTDLFIPYIGMFGYAAATANSPANIYNLTLSDYEIVVDSANAAGASAFVGGIVGIGTGVSLTGCKVENARITVSGDDNYFSYVGGLMGATQSAYQSDSVRYMSAIVSCAAENLRITVPSGLVYSAGGLVGQMVTAHEQTPALIINSYVSGSNITSTNAAGTSIMNAGGLVGVMTAYGVIENSYTANTRIVANNQIPSGAADQYRYANIGGIVGQAENDTLIVNSFTVGNTISGYASAGTSFLRVNGITGYAITANLPYVSSIPATEFNSYVGSDTVTINNDFIENTLGWGRGDWVFGESGYPTINFSEATTEFELTLVGGADNTLNVANSLTYDLTMYYPLSYLYLGNSTATVNYVPEYVTAGSLRSYGYYFDAALTKRVTNSFIPVNDITLYVGLADYNEVSGTYYLDTERYITLANDGIYTYHNGAQVFSTYYIYDGENIIFYSCPMFVVTETDGSISYVSATATLSDGVLTMDDRISTSGSRPLTAKAVIENFQYGEYYDAADNVYTFYANGTGTVVTAGTSSTTTAFTFVVANGTTITITPATSSTAPITGTVANGLVTAYDSIAVTKFDEFKGVWEAQADIYAEIEFDGKGGATVIPYNYNADGERVPIEDQDGNTTYTLLDGVVSFNAFGVDYTAKFVDGYLVVTMEGYDMTFYRQYSYVGTWVFPSRNNEPVTLTLNGIAQNGIGQAVARYDVADVSIPLTYGVTDGELTFYYQGEAFGSLEFAANKSLTGSFYSYNYDAVQESRSFFLIDTLSGVWLGSFDNGATLTTISFNGYGLYNQSATTNQMAVVSRVTLNGTNAGRYTLIEGVSYGTFTYRGVYTFNYNTSNNTLEVQLDDGEYVVFTRPDVMYQTRLYSTVENTSSTYQFSGNGKLTVVAVTTPAEGEPTTATTVYDYVVLESGNIELREVGQTTVVGTITVTTAENETSYSLTMVGGSAISLTTTLA